MNSIQQNMDIEHISNLTSSLEIEDFLQQWKNGYNDECDFKVNIIKIMNYIQDLYHNQGESPWSDAIYDMVVDILKDKYNIDVETNIIGSSIKGSQCEITELPYFMGSMNKFKTPKLVANWMSKYKGPYIVSAKLDGISAMYVNGKLYTRGNGIRGRDISYLIPFLKMGSDHTRVLRGELIMKKKIFHDTYKKDFSNPRNLVCGIMNRQYKKEYESVYKDIDFVVYDMYNIDLNYYNKFTWLKENGFNVVPHISDIKCLDVDKCDSYLTTWKLEDFIYEIDGIIISNYDIHVHDSKGNPDFAFAYKNNDIGVNMSIGIVNKVIWNISKDSYLKPTIQLQNCIYCDHSKVEYVTGFNAKYIIDNKICHGSKLKIGLSGSVIPHIFSVLETPMTEGEDEIHYLKDIDCLYKWSKNKVDLICSEKDNFQSIIKKNVMFFKSLELKCNLQEKTLQNVYDSIGIYHLKDILSLSLEQWVNVHKTGEKKATSIMNALYDVLHWPALIQQAQFDFMEYYLKLCVGLQCFERGFAHKKIKLYIEYLLDLSFIDMKQCYKNDYIESKRKNIIDSIGLLIPKQITCITMNLFIDGMISMNDKMNSIFQENTPFTFVTMQILLEEVVDEYNKMDVGNHIVDYEFVFSGFRPSSTFIKNFEKSGGKIVNDVSKKTTGLIVKDKHVKPTKKMQNAIKLGVSIYTVDEFINTFKEYKDILLM